MFSNGIFREEALNRQAEPELRHKLLRVTAPREWMLLWAIAAIALAAVAWSALASVEQTLRRQGAFLLPGDRHEVVATVSGVVAEAISRPGDSVGAGEMIARVTSSSLDRQLRVADARIQLLKELAVRSDDPGRMWIGAALASAQAEMVELAAIASAGMAIVSPHAGEIVASSLTVGLAVTVGDPVAEIRNVTGDQPDAVMLVSPDDGDRIAVGMKARIIPVDQSGARALPAEVISVSSLSAPGPAWIQRFGLAPPGEAGAGRIVRLAIDWNRELAMPDGAACIVEIVLKRSSPFGLALAGVTAG